jgi:hypothetical protein
MMRVLREIWLDTQRPATGLIGKLRVRLREYDIWPSAGIVWESYTRAVGFTDA